MFDFAQLDRDDAGIAVGAAHGIGIGVAITSRPGVPVGRVTAVGLTAGITALLFLARE